jgi:PTH2 family peptidyl-tRNA hydrolase
MKKEIKNNVKQVVLVRKDINMSVGKISSQVAHACMKIFFDKLISTSLIKLPYSILEDRTIRSSYSFYDMVCFENGKILPHDEYFDEYFDGSFKKIILEVYSEKELLELYQKAKDKNIHCSLIKDSGLTEFNLVPTYTTVCIGPWIDSEIDEITGHLKLLK